MIIHDIEINAKDDKQFIIIHSFPPPGPNKPTFGGGEGGTLPLMNYTQPQKIVQYCDMAHFENRKYIVQIRVVVIRVVQKSSEYTMFHNVCINFHDRQESYTDAGRTDRAKYQL